MKEKAEEFYKTFYSILEIRDMRIGANPFVKSCALACVDKIINEIINDKERVEYYRSVRQLITEL